MRRQVCGHLFLHDTHLVPVFFEQHRYSANMLGVPRVFSVLCLSRVPVERLSRTYLG
jgi:hypothetical protein